MPPKKDGNAYLHKTITVREDQVEFLEANSMSLSKFVQNKLDVAMGIKKERAGK